MSHGRERRGARAGASARRASAGHDDEAPREGQLAAFVTPVVAVIAAIVLAELWRQAAAGTLATDECFHAVASATLLREHRFPVEFPQFYGGFFDYYPPLFHVLGALWSGGFGAAALHGLPVALFGALLALLLLRPLGRGSWLAGAWAAAIVAANPALQRYAVRFYAEGLVTLLALAVVILAGRAIERPSRGTAIALGLAMGGALLTKFNAWMLVAPVLAAAVLAARAGRAAQARALLLATGIALALATPWMVRNQLLYGSAFYPALAPDLDRELYALNRATFSTPPLVFLSGLPRTFGWPLLALVGGAAAAAGWRRRAGWREGFLAACVLATLALPIAPYAAERHVNPFLPPIALLAASIVARGIAPRRGVAVAVSAALIALAATSAWRAENHRTAADLPLHLREGFRALSPLLSPADQVLSLWTYDTAYYTGARATWPNPWGQRDRPIDPFLETDPDRFLASLRRHGITHLLVPASLPAVRWNGANYPESFARCVNALLKRGLLRNDGGTGALRLLRVEPA